MCNCSLFLASTLGSYLNVMIQGKSPKRNQHERVSTLATVVERAEGRLVLPVCVISHPNRPGPICFAHYSYYSKLSKRNSFNLNPIRCYQMSSRQRLTYSHRQSTIRVLNLERGSYPQSTDKPHRHFTLSPSCFASHLPAHSFDASMIGNQLFEINWSCKTSIRTK